MIDEKTLDSIAKLARLFLTPEEYALYQGQVGDVLRYIDKLNQLDTEGIEPTFHIIDVENVYREDKNNESLPVEKALLNAPLKERNCFKVPKIIEE
jgi:aspartyl-tRNA(Asn)/glutamyl-tRNA(Gln) amidotransferase subunit C